MRFRKNINDTIALIILFAIFGFFAIGFEVQECGDSFQYINRHPMREPVYSLILQLFQFVAGGKYTVLLGLFQNILAVICVYWTYKRLKLMYEMNELVSYLSLLLLLVPHILTPLASKTHIVMTMTIMTEGITFSLFYVWFTIILGIVTDFYEQEKIVKSYVCGLGLGFLLALTRGQMAICIILWIIVGSYKAIVNKKYKMILLILIAGILAFPMKTQLTKIYNLVESGYYVDTVSSKPMLLANIVYVADEKDAEYIKEDDLRETFVKILVQAKEDGKTIENADKGIMSRALYHAECHDVLNFDYIDPNMREVIKKRSGIDEEQFFELMIMEDKLCGQIAKELLPHMAGRFICNYMVIVALGFVRTVATERFHLYILAFVLYLLALVVLLYDITKRGLNKKSLSVLLLVLSICGTVFGTSLVIQCIERYMIYNMPFFYILGLVMVRDLYDEKIKRKDIMRGTS